MQHEMASPSRGRYVLQIELCPLFNEYIDILRSARIFERVEYPAQVDYHMFYSGITGSWQ
jgi:hypothetical protein